MGVGKQCIFYLQCIEFQLLIFVHRSIFVMLYVVTETNDVKYYVSNKVLSCPVVVLTYSITE